MTNNIRVIVLFFIPILSIATTFTQPPLKLGIENLSENLISQLRKKNIGLITNHTGLDQSGLRTIDILLNKEIPIKKIFVPEHGLNGVVNAGDTVKDAIDAKTKIPVISLYKHGSGRQITKENFVDIDLIVFDIQDIGMRHYTYISTLYKTLQAAGTYDKRLIVLDRPNPLGSVMEGPLVENTLESFISIAPIPLRHGMTIGELAHYFNTYHIKKPAQLKVVRMENYIRTQSLPSTISHKLSPNIQNRKSAHGYSFLGLLGEIKPLNVAVGTKDAFQCIMLPESQQISTNQWQNLQAILQKHNIATSLYSYNNKKNKVTYRGIKLTFENIDRVSSFSALLQVLYFFKQQNIELAFSPFFDKAIGTTQVRKLFTENLPKNHFAQSIQKDLLKFYKKAQTTFLYNPAPKVTILN